MRTFIFSLPLLWGAGTAAEPLNVAVASNLTHAATEISEAFYRDEGSRARLSFGSSGNFARQIVQGAPFGVFISAAGQYAEFVRLHSERQTVSRILAYGGLSLYLPESSGLEQPHTLAQALMLLQYDDYRRLAIANPEHAPYGQAAKSALVNAGVWMLDHKKLLLGENAAQAMQFCRSGSVDLCIVPGSFLRLAQFVGKGSSFLLPERWHPPVAQHAVLLNTGDARARRYYDYLGSAASVEIFKKYGYRIP